MAEKENKESLIDSVYHKFVNGISRAIGSTEFYEFFMDRMSYAKHEFQFSNRRMIKSVDMTWVEAIEDALGSIQNIVYSPRNVIKEEELIVNVAHAKKAGSETVRHLAMHSALVEDFNSDNGDVRPSKLMQRYREDSIGLYENRLVFSAMELAHRFVQVRHDALLEIMGDEFGAKLKIKTDMDCGIELVHMDMFLHIKDKENILDVDEKYGDVLSRISRIYRVLGTYMNTDFAQQMAKLQRVSGTINKTNILKKNPDYRKVLQMWEFLKSYTDVGYNIKVVEQNPEINARLQEDIFRNILFNYLILKGYLESERDRKVPVDSGVKLQVLKPKIIHQIIEELTQDYDLPDVEIRKVLIEELTREQLMEEEAAERLRLVEDQEARRTEEEKQKRAQMRLEKEQIRKEKEAEEARRNEKQKLRAAEDHRRSKIFRGELEFFLETLENRIVERQERESLWNRPREDFAEAAGIMEAEELRQRAMEYLKSYAEELEYFSKNLKKRMLLREKAEEEYRLEVEEREKLRRERIAKKSLVQ